MRREGRQRDRHRPPGGGPGAIQGPPRRRVVPARVVGRRPRPVRRGRHPGRRGVPAEVADRAGPGPPGSGQRGASGLDRVRRGVRGQAGVLERPGGGRADLRRGGSPGLPDRRRLGRAGGGDRPAVRRSAVAGGPGAAPVRAGRGVGGQGGPGPLPPGQAADRRGVLADRRPQPADRGVEVLRLERRAGGVGHPDRPGGVRPMERGARVPGGQG